MGWISDDAPDHVGAIVNITDDGREGRYSTYGGVLCWDVTQADRDAGYEIHPGSHGIDKVVIPWERVMLWRIQCACGWTGGMRPAHTEHELGQAWRECPDELADEVFFPQWRHHIDLVAPLVALLRLAEQRADIDQQIDQTAPLARYAGHSWTKIGAAVGISKQAAQQRWGGAVAVADTAVARRGDGRAT